MNVASWEEVVIGSARFPDRDRGSSEGMCLDKMPGDRVGSNSDLH